MKSSLYVYILLFSISSTVAVQLDGTCSNNAPCEGSNVICTNGKCQCNFPAYVPCRSQCELNRNYAYEGDSCEVTENCISYAICAGKKCACTSGFTAKSGLCLKSLNAVCSNGTECWSQYCSSSRCACAPSYEPNADNISCKGKLVKIYNNWAEANSNREFCIDDSSCIDALATCIPGPQNTVGKFCKCPSGYRVQNNENCELIVSSLLSPLETLVSNYGECGSCADDNAVCAKAADETTCWCRVSYEKKNNNCEKQATKPLLIFPNANDVNLHDFAANCIAGNNETTIVDNKLCVCAPGYEFVANDQTCVKTQPKWINNMLEYGVCTRITSNDNAISVAGLCPEPLTCEARKDKHVCTCGRGKFLDLNDPSQCVTYIGTATNSTATRCLIENSILNSTTTACECIAGYKAADENRKCEVKLSSEVFQSPCNSNQFNNTICTLKFGNTALFCSVGECRCPGVQSFPNKQNTRCTAVLNQTLATVRAECPSNSTLQGSRCECNSGYRPSNDLRECIPLALQLVEYTGPATTSIGDLTTADCRAMFNGSVVPYTRDRCQCSNDSLINDDKSGCRYRLGVTFTSPSVSSACPPNSNSIAQQACECDVAYTANGDKCVPKSNRVYNDNDPTAPNIPGLLDSDCAKLFGLSAAIASNGSYCICKSSAYSVRSNTFCYLLINQTTADIKTLRDCPANTNIFPEGPPSACVCKPGFYMSSDRRECRTASVGLGGAANASQTRAACVNVTNTDCVAKFGANAFCQDETCFCDRQQSFVNAAGQCEPFSKYVFPGEHEHHLYACTAATDCGGTENVACDYLNSGSEYKVCQCKDGSLLDPNSKKCSASRCIDNCNAALNFECRGYACECKTGYYRDGSRCVQSPFKPQLNQPCNQSALWQYAFAADNGSLECNLACERARCKPGYKAEQSQCVQNELENLKCVYQESVCPQIDENAICNRDENECWCRPSFYQLDNTCVRAVGSPCQSDEQCGGSMICKGQRCDCNPNQRIQEILDKYGRVIRRCVNGIGRIQFSPVVILFFILARTFFI
ncbi:unnamed protein product [Rotaria socialis]|uniref:EGF-like domain-containing protein n=2 Tax=Rotaria socialis TaxID=392032 RepID=A0A821MA43_9BILA|nr:unnamed protein product [Rotaria socialis]CAF4764574.1 unnamed protein product [Rotaria socialis]